MCGLPTVLLLCDGGCACVVRLWGRGARCTNRRCGCGFEFGIVFPVRNLVCLRIIFNCAHEAEGGREGRGRARRNRSLFAQPPHAASHAPLDAVARWFHRVAYIIIPNHNTALTQTTKKHTHTHPTRRHARPTMADDAAPAPPIEVEADTEATAAPTTEEAPATEEAATGTAAGAAAGDDAAAAAEKGAGADADAAYPAMPITPMFTCVMSLFSVFGSLSRSSRPLPRSLALSLSPPPPTHR
jgi:hypothetical protein